MKALETYSLLPSLRQLRSVEEEVEEHLNQSGELQMAALEGHLNLGHSPTLFKTSGFEMKKIRMRKARFIFDQSKKLER